MNQCVCCWKLPTDLMFSHLDRWPVLRTPILWRLIWFKTFLHICEINTFPNVASLIIPSASTFCLIKHSKLRFDFVHKQTLNPDPSPDLSVFLGFTHSDSGAGHRCCSTPVLQDPVWHPLFFPPTFYSVVYLMSENKSFFIFSSL